MHRTALPRSCCEYRREEAWLFPDAEHGARRLSGSLAFMKRSRRGMPSEYANMLYCAVERQPAGPRARPDHVTRAVVSVKETFGGLVAKRLYVFLGVFFRRAVAVRGTPSRQRSRLSFG